MSKKDKSKVNTVSMEPEKTTIKALGLGGLITGGAPCAVDFKDGKVIRVRPLHYDWKYTRRK